MLVGERGLAELLEDRSAVLRLERVLDELLGDRGPTLGGATGKHVLDPGAEQAPEVHPAVLVKRRSSIATAASFM